MTIIRWVILAFVFVVRTGFGFQFQSVGSVSGLMREDLVLSHAQIGTLIRVYMLPGVFFTWYYVAMAVGPAAGAGRDWTGSSSTPLLIAAGMYVAIIVVIMAFRSYAGRSSGVLGEGAS
jgi:hypothetical protein